MSSSEECVVGLQKPPLHLGPSPLLKGRNLAAYSEEISSLPFGHNEEGPQILASQNGVEISTPGVTMESLFLLWREELC